VDKSIWSGVSGERSVLLPASMVPGGERPCLPHLMEPTLPCLHIILLFLPGRDSTPRQVVDELYQCFKVEHTEMLILFSNNAVLLVESYLLVVFTVCCGVKVKRARLCQQAQ
jgi:hypothetical protein